MTNYHSKLEMMADNQIQGIAIDPLPATAGDEITFLYNGLLANSGADQVFIHCGYGDNRHWFNVANERMEWTGHGWAKTMELANDTRLNFCFKDSAQNWDNNNGQNWTIEIHNGR
jgi:hypothetical protein